MACAALARGCAIPSDVNPADVPNLKIGAITDLPTVQKTFDLRSSVADTARSEPVDVIRTIETSVH